MVTSRAIYAALLESNADGLNVTRRFMRQRSTRFGVTQGALPDSHDAGGGDFTLQIGEGGDFGDNMFLGAEFGVGGPGVGEEGNAAAGANTSFVLELGDILAECRDAGYDNPTLAFCVSPSEVNQVELRLPASGKATEARANTRLGQRAKDREAKPAKPGAPASRGQLMELLKHQHKGLVLEDLVTFLPMTPSDEGMRRYLAIFPKPEDSVAATVRALREQEGRRLPSIRLEDAEVPVYLGIARAALNLAPASPELSATAERNTLVVRAGIEDTLVLFLHEDQLQQSENLRSLTAYEAPETICSRVLLLQDEYGIGDVHHVLLLSEEREDDLISSFEMFFPDARVESMRQYVPQITEDTAEGVASGSLLPAVGVGLRLTGDPRYEKVFEDVNLLPKALMRRRVSLPITWHVLALYVLLFVTVLFFVGRYFSMESDIAEHRRNIQQLRAQTGSIPDEITDVQALQARIDSLQAVHEQYMRALQVLEGLLRGSDLWSRALEETSREVGEVSGIWVEEWSPGGNTLRLSGSSMERDRVVDLAARLEANIVELSFSEIRDWPVYSFEMQVPLENALPEAAQFLREQVATSGTAAADSTPVTSVSLQEQQ